MTAQIGHKVNVFTAECRNVTAMQWTISLNTEKQYTKP